MIGRKHGITAVLAIVVAPKPCDGDCLFATITGDTRSDIELVKQ